VKISTLRVIRVAAWLAIVLICGVLVWTFISPRQNPATTVAASTVGGPFSLTDQTGAAVTEAAL
jgi:cytochrome oxidase Cu insertion factor (SCO1/SenC/PrrC family)